MDIRIRRFGGSVEEIRILWKFCMVEGGSVIGKDLEMVVRWWPKVWWGLGLNRGVIRVSSLER